MTLTNSDKKHWAPNPQLLDWLTQEIPPDAKVLDVGPGHAPFARADVSVDFVDVAGVKTIVKCDLGREPLPFEDKSFDFIYCRHTLEDMWNPFGLIAEMSRVGRAGYIETPSPLAEIGRGVDGGSPPYRGYHHHRFIVWVHRNELRFVSKYPLIEYLNLDDTTAALRLFPRYWNTYYLWTDRINAVHRQSPLDFDIPRDYGMLLNDAVKQSKEATDAFWCKIPDTVQTAPVMLRSFAASNA